MLINNNKMSSDIGCKNHNYGPLGPRRRRSSLRDRETKEIIKLTTTILTTKHLNAQQAKARGYAYAKIEYVSVRTYIFQKIEYTFRSVR